MRHFIFSFGLALALLLPPAGLALAQDPQPTPTPTPPWQYGVTLSSGAQLVIERRISYGEIAVATAILGLLGLFVIWIGFRAYKLWFPS